MTELEVYLHGTIQNIKDALMTDGLASDAEFLIANLCDSAHKVFLGHLNKEIQKTLTGPGGVHHEE